VTGSAAASRIAALRDLASELAAMAAAARFALSAQQPIGSVRGFLRDPRGAATVAAGLDAATPPTDVEPGRATALLAKPDLRAAGPRRSSDRMTAPRSPALATDPAAAALDAILPARFFERSDPSDDGDFYAAPRFVAHIDDATIAAVTDAYRSLVPAGSRVLDLMSSWISHLPADVAYARVAGHGMNAAELERNPRLTERLVRDLNREPELPWPDESFDAALCAVSVQYLTRPLRVFRSVRHVLAPGSPFVVAISHRMFPTKAIAIWHPLGVEDRARMVALYFRLSGGWSEPEFLDRSPAGADPLVLVVARRA
jgi:SAM-dependent methyltransferase